MSKSNKNKATINLKIGLTEGNKSHQKDDSSQKI